MLKALEQHPLRQVVSAEIHARPVPSISGPASVRYLALMKDRDDPEAARKHVTDFLQSMDDPPLGEGEACCYRRLGEAELRWESHQEFCSYLLIMPQASETHFPEPDLPGWWKRLTAEAPGKLINAIRLELREGGLPADPITDLPGSFDGDWIMGGRVVDGLASVWTDFRQDKDGMTRFLVLSEGLSAFQAGRTCQRLLESDTYRTVALLGFPLARAVWPSIHRLDADLVEVTSDMSEHMATESDRRLLERLSGLSTRIEQLRARTNFRFSASTAYAEIALRRLEDLREERWQGTSSLLKFTERRFLPAIQTCRDADRHLQALSERVGQATALLRTRVELNQQEQNQKLLDAINRRSATQLRLQQVVEGFSVIAITYYLVGLIKVGVEGATMPPWLHVPGGKAAAIALLALVVSFYIRRRKRQLVGPED